jgi:stearoyl-CoA desaturase (delta-9 desaturase)
VIAVLVGLATSQVAIVLTTIYLHRATAHKAVTFTKPLQVAFRAYLWVATGIKPREWAAVHRRHHAFTDIEGDPHSPLLLGMWRVEFTNAALYRRAARDGVTVEKYAKDIPADRWDKVLFDHPYLGLGIGITILCLLLGWQYGLIASAVHMVSYLLLNGAVNAFAHVHGKQPYENNAGNLQWLAWLVAGEGLHNNHHAAPTAARLSHQPGERDPGWWAIALLVKFHQASVRLDAPKFIKAPAQASAP